MRVRSLAVMAVLALSVITMSGCGPIYNTAYRYIPPNEMGGRRCLNQCSSIREMCYSTAEHRAASERASCEQSAAIRYAACLASAKKDSDRRACSSSSFCNQTADTWRCKREYDRCYIDCGGRIEPYEVCVFNCN